MGMAVSVLVEALLPGDVAAQGGAACKGGVDGKPENVKEWIRNKLKASASLLGKLEVKAAKALPGNIGQLSVGSLIGQKM